MQRDAAGHSDADRGHLARRAPVVLRHPHAGTPLDPAGGQPELGAHVDQQLLGTPDVRDHVDRVGQPDDRVADELPRAVPGDLPAAVHVHHRGAVHRPVPRLGALAGGVDAGVLQQQHRVALLAGHHRLVQPALLVPGGLVVEQAGADGGQPGSRHAHPSSLVPPYGNRTREPRRVSPAPATARRPPPAPADPAARWRCAAAHPRRRRTSRRAPGPAAPPPARPSGAGPPGTRGCCRR